MVKLMHKDLRRKNMRSKNKFQDTKQNISIRPYIHELYRKSGRYFMPLMIITILDTAENLFIAWLLQKIADFIGGVDVGFTFTELCTTSLFAIILMLMSTALTYYAMPHFVNDGMRRYKEFIFKKITKKNISAFSSENSSIYISALTNDAATISNGLLRNIPNIVQSILLLICSLIMMAYYDLTLTVVTILLAFFPFLISILFGNSSAKAESAISSQNGEYVASIKDALGGFSVIKSFKAEVEMCRLFASNTRQLAAATTKRDRINTIISMLANLASLFTQFGVFLIAAYLSIKNSSITSGIVLMFVQMVNYVVGPISTLPSYYAQIKASLALVRKCAETLDNNTDADLSLCEHKTLDECIRVEDLSFSYGGTKQALKSFSYSFELGKKYAIVGASGSGKSTLLNLLMGASNEYSGSIRYDGFELRELKREDLYDIQSLIQQNVFVFNASILDNITMFKPFPEDDIARAIKLSGLGDLIIEKGADYICGENGSALSGGEKQRLSIARALLKNSQVLMIDEATAALDAETAYQVTDSILKLKGITTIEITHALDASLLARYDGILVFKNGEMIESGDFDELIEKKGYFYSLFTVSQ